MIQWCLIFKIILQKNWNVYECVHKGSVLKGTVVENLTFRVPQTRAGSILMLSPLAVCPGASYRARWALVFSFVIWHNEVCGRQKWLSMQNPFSSYFLANTVTNLFRFGADLSTEKSGLLLTLEKQIFISLIQLTVRATDTEFGMS